MSHGLTTGDALAALTHLSLLYVAVGAAAAALAARKVRRVLRSLDIPDREHLAFLWRTTADAPDIGPLEARLVLAALVACAVLMWPLYVLDITRES